MGAIINIIGLVFIIGLVLGFIAGYYFRRKQFESLIRGLFVARLNNGDWMVGRSSYIYHISILDDHYSDPNLTIRPKLQDAIEEAYIKTQGKSGEK